MLKTELEIFRAKGAAETVVFAKHANTFLTRMRGLLGRKPLQGNDGLLLSPCNQVHTIGMRYSLDVVYLDKHGVVIKCVEDLAPFRFSAARGARHTLELAANSVKVLGIKPGEHLVWK
ncbi:MAG: DUF192 domain-containing protein [Pseudomonadales bacterium]